MLPLLNSSLAKLIKNKASDCIIIDFSWLVMWSRVLWITLNQYWFCFSTSQVLPTVAHGFISHGSSDILVILSSFVRPTILAIGWLHLRWDSLLPCRATPVLLPYLSMALGSLPKGLVSGSVFQRTGVNIYINDNTMQVTPEFLWISQTFVKSFERFSTITYSRGVIFTKYSCPFCLVRSKTLLYYRAIFTSYSGVNLRRVAHNSNPTKTLQ